jgi:hypothetical protein
MKYSDSWSRLDRTPGMEGREPSMSCIGNPLEGHIVGGKPGTNWIYSTAGATNINSYHERAVIFDLNGAGGVPRVKQVVKRFHVGEVDSPRPHQIPPVITHVDICIRTLSAFLRTFSEPSAPTSRPWGLLPAPATMRWQQKGAPKKSPSGLASTGRLRRQPHSMSHGEYPFDAGGNYVSSWAAEGERIRRAQFHAQRWTTPSWKSSHGTRFIAPRPVGAPGTSST